MVAQRRARGCACSHLSDGGVHTSMCPLHADQDPCLTVSLITGRRRKGTIKRGACTNCGWGESEQNTLTVLTDALSHALEKGERADFEFRVRTRRWILTLAPVEG